MADLSVTLGRLQFRNPILVASGTFGYAREMAGIVDFSQLGGIIPKTVSRHPRAGNIPPRTVETHDTLCPLPRKRSPAHFRSNQS